MTKEAGGIIGYSIVIRGPVMIYHPDAVRGMLEQAYHAGLEDGHREAWHWFCAAVAHVFRWGE